MHTKYEPDCHFPIPKNYIKIFKKLMIEQNLIKEFELVQEILTLDLDDVLISHNPPDTKAQNLVGIVDKVKEICLLLRLKRNTLVKKILNGLPSHLMYEFVQVPLLGTEIYFLVVRKLILTRLLRRPVFESMTRDGTLHIYRIIKWMNPIQKWDFH